MTNLERENNEKVQNYMVNVIKNACQRKKKITCQEILDSATDLCKKLKTNPYGNFGPIKHILWNKADAELRQLMKVYVTNKHGEKIYQSEEWKIFD